jgi:hypothetical protein
MSLNDGDEDIVSRADVEVVATVDGRDKVEDATDCIPWTGRCRRLERLEGVNTENYDFNRI